MNATPRPWKLHNNHRDYKIYRENGHTIIYHSKRGEAAITPSYDDATLIVRAVNSYDAMRELINQNDDLLAELSQYVSDEHIRLIAEQRKRNNDTLDRIEEGEINQ